tara:strand:+ start:1088 stop:1285 length:198 start_codon:yes stop_codon:yes gene_type:complete
MTKQLIIALKDAITQAHADLNTLSRESRKAESIYQEVSIRYRAQRDKLDEMLRLNKALEKAEKAS